jgi:hypothetical protein
VPPVSKTSELIFRRMPGTREGEEEDVLEFWFCLIQQMILLPGQGGRHLLN